MLELGIGTVKVPEAFHAGILAANRRFDEKNFKIRPIRRSANQGGPMPKKTLRKLSSSKVTIFKIKNRRGYAAVSMNNLTEGRTPVQAFERMIKAVKRAGFELKGNAPKPR